MTRIEPSPYRSRLDRLALSVSLASSRAVQWRCLNDTPTRINPSEGTFVCCVDSFPFIVSATPQHLDGEVIWLDEQGQRLNDVQFWGLIKPEDLTKVHDKKLDTIRAANREAEKLEDPHA